MQHLVALSRVCLLWPPLLADMAVIVRAGPDIQSLVLNQGTATKLILLACCAASTSSTRMWPLMRSLSTMRPDEAAAQGPSL